MRNFWGLFHIFFITGKKDIGLPVVHFSIPNRILASFCITTTSYPFQIPCKQLNLSQLPPYPKIPFISCSAHPSHLLSLQPWYFGYIPISCHCFFQWFLFSISPAVLLGLLRRVQSADHMQPISVSLCCGLL